MQRPDPSAPSAPIAPSAPFAAVVLAGGAGRRLGGVDKATLEVEGEALVVRVVGACRAAGALEVVVVGPSRAGMPWHQVQESPAGSGPIAGAASGLAALSGSIEVTLVLAVDMPHLTAATVRRLIDAVPAGGDGAVLVGPDGRRHLAMALRRAAATPVLAVPADLVDAPVWKTLAPLDLVEVPAVDREHEDIDTPDDLARVGATAGATRLTRMRAVIVPTPGGPEALTIVERPDLVPGPGEVVIDVVATAVNKADTLQRQGFYNPPPGATDVLGLECSGRIARVGEGVEGWQVGDEVCALLSGGGYAAQVLVPAGQVMGVPEGVDLVTAAALPETCATVWSNVFMRAGLQPGETFLVHGGAGGIGTTAIQIASAMSAKVFTTAGSPEKVAFCAELGADVAINYREEDFVEVVRGATDGAGVDVILDNMGAKYLPRNVDALAVEGHLVVIGMQGGVKGELNLATLLGKRASVSATSLRPRPVEEKSQICAELVEYVWPLVADGQVTPIVHAVLPLEQIAEAHRMIDASEHTGKILLTL